MTDSTATTPSFAGRWVLSLAKSDFGKGPGKPPTARTDTITHEGPRLRQALVLERGGQTHTPTYDYVTDGTPCVNKVEGKDVTTIAVWEGPVLHLESTTKLLMFTIRLSERWSLSADGATLTYARHMRYGLGESDQTLVFERA